MIPLHDDIALHALLRLPEESELPADVVALYGDFKRLRDFGNSGPIQPDVLAWLVFQLKGPPEVEPETFSVQRAAKNGELASGDTVLVLWRKKETEAVFRSVTPRQTAIVLLEGDTDEREVKVEAVLGVVQRV